MKAKAGTRKSNWTRYFARGLLVLFVIFAGYFIWNAVVGRTERVRYTGQGPISKDGAALLTEPKSNWHIERGALFYSLKQECVYEFNYNPGIDPRTDPTRERWVRRAKLIECRG